MPRVVGQYKSREDACKAALTHLEDLGRIRAGWTVPANPEPVYVYRASEVKGLQLPPNAAPSSWQFSTDDGAGTRVNCEVNNGPLNEIISVSYGQSAEESASAKGAARQRPDLASGAAELRVVRIPELILEGLWLLSKAGTGDSIVPLGSSFGSFARGEPAAVDRFLAERLAAAQEL